MSEKLLIVGGVAGGASAAARARRLDEHTEIILFERGGYISFANCGLPYYIGNEITDRDALLVTTVETLRDRFNIDVRIFNEVTEIHRNERKVIVRDIRSGETYTEEYDTLILSPGGIPVRPRLEGIDLESVFTLWTIPDADDIKDFITRRDPRSAVVIGGGFIGLEMAENLKALGMEVTLVEMLDHVLPPMDPEMASLVQDHLAEKGVRLHLHDGVRSFQVRGDCTIVTTMNGTEIQGDLVMLCIGVRAESDLAKNAGLELSIGGGIITDTHMRTSDPNIYAVGDAVEVREFISGRPVMIPLAGPANKQGRIAADHIFARDTSFEGTQGTAVVKVFDLTVAFTGNSETALRDNGVQYLASYTQSGSHASYYPGAQTMNLKLLFAPGDGRILGAQIVGMEGVDKRIDVLATAIRAGMTVFDLEELELAYAPPYSSAKDPVNMAGFVAANILRGDHEIIHWYELDDLDRDSDVLLDVREDDEIKTYGTIEGAVHIPINQLRGRISELDKEKTYIAFCAIGQRGYVAQRMLVQHGFTCRNLSGGYTLYSAATRSWESALDQSR